MPRALFVASSGGHLDELYQLRPSLVDDSTTVRWVTFDCAHSRSVLAAEPDVVYIDDVGPRAYFALLRAVVPAIRLLRRTRPTAVYSTGAAIALAFLPLAFLVGARATYIESAARIAGPSRTGRLLAMLPWVRLRTQYAAWATKRWQHGDSVFDGMQPYSLSSARRPIRRVVVTLGTQPKYPFVELVERVRQIVPAGVEVRWQVGNDFPVADRPDGAHSMVPTDELREWISGADAVVAHGGVGSALTALRAGRQPVLVARRAEFGEHVDDHQAQLVSELVGRGLAVAATPRNLTWDHIVRSTRTLVEPAAPEFAAAQVGAAEPAASAVTAGTAAGDAAGTAAGAVLVLDRPRGAHRPDVRRRSTPDGTRLRRRVVVAALSVVSLLVAGESSADAVGVGFAQSTIPTAVPSKATPNVTNGTVFAITQVGSQIILGGDFTGVQNQGSTTTMTRTDLLAFNATTGTVSTTFAPTLDGAVQAVTPGPVANTVYVGGYFTTVNGVKSKSVTLLDTTTGRIVTGFKPPVVNGSVFSLATVPGHLLATGTFTTAGSAARGGTMSLNPSTGALDTYLQVALAGHHNYKGVAGTADGAVGGRAMAVNPSGTRLVLVGNFKTAATLPRDQIVMIDLGSTAAVVDPTWASTRYTATCSNKYYDSYVRDVQFAPDGSYFATVATGGATTSLNTDGSRSLCDAAARWETATVSTSAAPTWVDYTGNDTLWSVAISGSAVYVGGHQRWLNNDSGFDSAGYGAVPRPGLAALDPINGVPLAWNPGRNPRGAGAYALFLNSAGLYVGSDTDEIGNYTYKRQKIAYFPLAGGAAPASTAVATLPANVYSAGATVPEAGTTAASLSWRPVSGTRTAPSTAVPSTGIDWSTTRGAFMVGSTIFWGGSDGNFYRATFTGSTVGTPVAVDPYNDPRWATVSTGSKLNGVDIPYRGVRPTYYSEIASLTGAFYSGGRLFYTLAGRSQLFWRWFSPDSGIIGSAEYSTTGLDLRNVAGMFASAGSLYWADAADGTLHKATLVGTTVDPASDSVVGGPAVDGHDWRARGLFAYGAPIFPNQLPTAAASASCTGLNCTFDATASTDPDGTIASYAWTFGDGSTSTSATATHGFANAGSYPVTVTVTDNRGGTATWTGSVTAAAPSAPVGFVGTADANDLTSAPQVTVPAGVQASDTELLYVTTGTNGVTTAPSGWQQLTVLTNAPLQTTVYTRTAGGADAGSTVAVALTASVRVDLRLVVYSGVSAVAATTAGDGTTASHVTPAVIPAAGGSQVVSYWSTRSSATSTWTTPASDTLRGTGVGTGGGHIDAVVADAGPVSTATYPAQTASSGSAGAKGGMVAVVLSPTP